MLTHLSKTNAFYRSPSVISKNIFFVDSQPHPPPFQCCNTLRGPFHVVTTLKRGEGVKMSKLEIEKLARLTKQVFFGSVSTAFVHDSCFTVFLTSFFGVGCFNKNGQASQSKASNDDRRSIQNKRRFWIEQLLSPYISCKVSYQILVRVYFCL